VKLALKTAIQMLALTLVYFVCFVVVSGALLSTTTDQPSPSEAGAAIAAILVVCLVQAAVWIYVIRRSRWGG
jgi:cytochrome c biogenesis factor